MLDHIGCFLERAVLADGQDANAAAREIGDQDVASGSVNDQVAGIGAVAGLRVQEG
jgi:hypothetical protein